jgi:transcriptional regulator
MGATWNYQTVHVRGTCRIMSDEETMELLTELTAHFEAHQETPLLTDQLPEGYMSAHIKGIAGLEINVASIYPIFKLSQNRDDASYTNIVQHLRSSADTDAQKIAVEMIQKRPQLFEVQV